MRRRLEEICEKPARIGAGVMSGTSLDGLDVAICRMEGSGLATRLELLYFETFPYHPEDQQRLLRACSPETATVADVCSLNKWLGVWIGERVKDAVAHSGMQMEDLDFISSHGQTIYHMPEEKATLQIGELADIAAVTGRLTLGDFRPSDMAYGGDGAPLAPFFDYLVLRSPSLSRVLINAGGIANLTAIPAGAGADDVMAFDTGPANVLADNLMKIKTDGQQTYDKDGALAFQGRLSSQLLQSMEEEDSYLLLPPPKSTGRELYTYRYAQDLLARGEGMGLSFEDILATVTDYSAYALARSVERFVPFTVDEYYLSGGGYHNVFLRNRLEERLSKPMHPLSRLGVDGDAKEAAFFAIFGNEFLHNSFNNIKSATGANRDVVMGKLALPSGLGL